MGTVWGVLLVLGFGAPLFLVLGGTRASRREAAVPIWLAYLGGSGVAMPLFGAVFWEFDMKMEGRRPQSTFFARAAAT